MCKTIEDVYRKAYRRGFKRGYKRWRDKERRAFIINQLQYKCGNLSKNVIAAINESDNNHFNQLLSHIFDINNEQDILKILQAK